MDSGFRRNEVLVGNDEEEVVMTREIVETVTGPVAASELGFTLSHEHVIVGFPGIRATYPELMDWDGIESGGHRDAVGGARGGTPVDHGRDAV